MARMNQQATDLLRYNAVQDPTKRSSFNKSHSHATTLDSGFVVPIMWDRVLPGDEKKISYNGLARMATPKFPTMDESYLDVFAFYVPDRLWWKNAKAFYGENLDASFNPDGEYEMPFLKPSQYYVRDSAENPPSYKYFGLGSLNDYFGMPIAHNSMSDMLFELDSYPEMRVCAGLHRSYQLIWNEWFRNSSIEPALRLNDGDDVTDDEWSVIQEIRLSNKLPDYFMTLLKEPQSGNDVMLPLGEWAPVVTREQSVNSLYYRDSGLTSSDGRINANGTLQYGTRSFGDGTFANEAGYSYFTTHQNGRLTVFNEGSLPTEMGAGYASVPTNLWANLTDASAATINNLRTAVTIQQLLEIDNAGGKRYNNIIYSHFGVLTPDATLGRPELLGTTRVNIGMRQVLQTSSTDATSPQGNVSGVSVTNVNDRLICDKAFTEPGFIMVLATIRPLNSYSQGVDSLLRKLSRYDHYWPVFDNLGNQPVFKSELYAAILPNVVNPSDVAARFDDVLGYKQAHMEYKTKMNRVSGLMRPDVALSLGAWNYSNNFSSVPSLTPSFIHSDPELMDRTIAVQSEPQFILDSYFEYIDVKTMGLYSLPGLTRF